MEKAHVDTVLEMQAHHQNSQRAAETRHAQERRQVLSLRRTAPWRWGWWRQ